MSRTPLDNDRCQYTYGGGTRRCRNLRLPGDQVFCYPHYNKVNTAPPVAPHPAFVSNEILPPDAELATATEVNAVLTRIFRMVADGRLSPKHASALAYLGQLIISTLPHLKKEAMTTHAPDLDKDPDTILDQLSATLARLVPKTRNGKSQTREEGHTDK